MMVSSNLKTETAGPGKRLLPHALNVRDTIFKSK